MGMLNILCIENECVAVADIVVSVVHIAIELLYRCIMRFTICLQLSVVAIVNTIDSSDSFERIDRRSETKKNEKKRTVKAQ